MTLVSPRAPTSVGAAIRRVLAIAAAVLVLLVLAGATYQGVATALERRDFPRPGGLVSVGDHQLHIYCTGQGKPVVVLEAPAAGLSAAWGDVQQRVSRITRVCSYDRAGLGWSEGSDRPFDPGRVAEELRTLLERAKEPGPFIVVGEGLGAVFAKLYAARPDSAAVALIAIDPPGGPEDSLPATVRLMRASPWLARMGVLRAGRVLSSKADGLGGQSGAAVRAFLNRPDHLTQAAAEVTKWDDAMMKGRLAKVPESVRVGVIQTNAADRIAFLTNTAHVDAVVHAIETAVSTARTPQP